MTDERLVTNSLILALCLQYDVQFEKYFNINSDFQNVALRRLNHLMAPFSLHNLIFMPSAFMPTGISGILFSFCLSVCNLQFHGNLQFHVHHSYFRKDFQML